MLKNPSGHFDWTSSSGQFLKFLNDKMAAIRRIIVNTANAPSAIGPYNQVYTSIRFELVLFIILYDTCGVSIETKMILNLLGCYG